jgi:hypothetical protein
MLGLPSLEFLAGQTLDSQVSFSIPKRILAGSGKVWHHTFVGSIKESPLATCSLPQSLVPNDQRLEHDGCGKREDCGDARRMRLICHRITGLMAGLSPAECRAMVSLLLKLQEGLPAYRGA